jgi:hypothetical protein
MRLIGRKSVIASAPSFFGNKTILAVFKRWKFCTESSEKAFMIPMRSSLMISEQEQKKAIEKPSGPGALSRGKSSMASLISNSEKGRQRSSKECAVGFKAPPQLKSSWRGGGRPKVREKCSKMSLSFSS